MAESAIALPVAAWSRQFADYVKIPLEEMSTRVVTPRCSEIWHRDFFVAYVYYADFGRLPFYVFHSRLLPDQERNIINDRKEKTGC